MKKSILITGCSSGIGYDTAHHLHKLGYTVYASARKQEDVERLRDEGLDTYLLDVTDAENIRDVLQDITSKGELYALFNNAGFGQPGALEDIKTNVLKEQFETNFFGLHELTYQVLPIMRKQGFGRIIQHSSILGLISLRFRGAYNATKYAIEGLCDTLRLELEGSNIFVCSINTGPVRSNFRVNATKKYYEHIDAIDSLYKEEYQKELLPYEKKKKTDPFTRESDVVIKNIIQALESSRPKPRYYNTEATYILAGLKRLLPTRALDKILQKI